jgi:hypothetical protein
LLSVNSRPTYSIMCLMQIASITFIVMTHIYITSRSIKEIMTFVSEQYMEHTQVGGQKLRLGQTEN